MEISYQSMRYLYKFISALFKHGSHGAAALTGLIQSVLNGSSRGGATKMKTLLKNSSGITGFTLAAQDYETFRQQAEEMKILYVPVRAETNPELLTIITSVEQAPLVGQIITVNGLEGFMNGTLEQAEQTQVVEQQAEPSLDADTSVQSENSDPSISPVDAEAVKDNEDFFAEFMDAEPGITSPAESPEGASEQSDVFFAAMTAESEIEADNTLYHQEPNIVELTATELEQQPQEIREAMQIIGTMPEPKEVEHPIQPEDVKDHPSGSELSPSNGSLTLTAEKPSIRTRMEQIKARQKSKDIGISDRARELMRDVKLPAIKL